MNRIIKFFSNYQIIPLSNGKNAIGIGIKIIEEDIGKFFLNAASTRSYVEVSLYCDDLGKVTTTFDSRYGFLRHSKKRKEDII